MQPSRIKIDIDRRIGRIDPKVYGNFVEHLGRCVYGGIFEEGSPLSDGRGFRKDVMAAVRGLKVPVLRWPGGNFVSGYHWQDGVGPTERRPRKWDMAWKAEESNRFGTDEFMAYCQAVGAEPYLCVNLGTGTVEEAAAWVEYCNGKGNTYYANLRRQNGHPEPYGVKYWGLGNEMYGFWQIGFKSAEDYAKIALEAAKLMKWTDPVIELVSCGANGLSDYDRIALDKLAPWVTYHSIHLYTGDRSYYPNVFAPAHAERCIRGAEAAIENARWRNRVEHPIYIAFDEWNQLYDPPANGSEHEVIYGLSDALAVAAYLNIFHRHADTVKMANLAQLVNVIAPIFTTTEGCFKQSIYHPLALYANHAREIALDVFVDGPTVDVREEDVQCNLAQRPWELSPFPVLDVSATVDEACEHLSLAVINRSFDQDIAVDITFDTAGVRHGARVHELNSDDVRARNSMALPGAVAPRETRLEQGGPCLSYTFPAHSLTFLEFEVIGYRRRGYAEAIGELERTLI